MIHNSLNSVREKEENMKTVEGLLEKGLIEVANKEEELKVSVFSKRHNQNMLAHIHTFIWPQLPLSDSA